MVRSHFDYCNSVWIHIIGDVEALEKVQKGKMLPETKKLNHSERLKRYKLPTLRYRSIQGDMIETSKILSGKYDTLPSSTLTVVGPTSTYNKVTKIELNTKGDQKVMQLRYKKTTNFQSHCHFPI